MRRLRRLTAEVAVEEVVAEAEAEVTGAVAALAQVPWVASAVDMLAALAEVARRVWVEITMAMEDVVSAALMTTAAVRITRHTTGPTTAPTER